MPDFSGQVIISMKNMESHSGAKIKAVGLISGGLDSALAVRLMKDLGVEVYGIFFVFPWGNEKMHHVRAMAEEQHIALKIFQLENDYLEMLKRPRFGYGSAFNPCMDCHLFMMEKAAQYLLEIGGEFIFTGEVMGQRPKSQKKDSLRAVEKALSLKGRLLRPLSALLLPSTVPEEEGMVDRRRLLDISGRSRKRQLALAEEWGIKTFAPPAGGCLLTEPPFGNKMKDFLQFGCRHYRETEILKWGRYFRLSEDSVAVLGRNEYENHQLQQHAWPEDLLMQLEEAYPGPVLILKSRNPSRTVLATAAALIQWHSKYKEAEPLRVLYCPVMNPQDKKDIRALKLAEQEIQSRQVN